MFKNNKILILGFARSGYEAAKLLVSRENEVILNDSKEEENLDLTKVNELKKLGVKLIFGSHPDDLFDNSFDYLIKNPGVPINHKYVLKAKELNIEVINEVEMAYRLMPKDITLIGITGTNGKTTTTTITYNILKEEYKTRVHLAGNIGYPLCSILNDLKKDDIVVMEVSCQQLENLSTFNPHIGVITNITRAHIDFLKTYEHYKEVKKRLLINQSKNDVAILNLEDKELIELTKDLKSTTKYFSSKNEINGCYPKDNKIYYYEEDIMSIKDIFIPGKHNLENILASVMIAKELNVKNETIKEIVKKFKGVEHRLEYVDTIKGRLFYNDTEATNIKSTQIALSSFNQNIILFLGGLERGQNFNELKEFMQNVKCIIAIGQSRNRVKDFGNSINIPTFTYETLQEGFTKAYLISEESDIILLSPASASWDQYKQCEDRGVEFKKLVEELKNEN